MAQLDPSIILAGGEINDPGKMLSLKELALRLQGQQQQVQSQNMLKQLFANPKTYNPQTGQIAPEALRGVLAADPKAGMDLMQDQAQLADAKLKRMGVIQDMIAPVRDSSLEAYDGVIKAGGSPEAAQAAGQKALEEGIDPIRTGGALSDEEKSQIATKFDPAQFRARALSYKDRKALEEKEKSDDRADRREGRMEHHEEVMEGIAERRMSQSGDSKWTVLTDPKANVQYRYNPETGKSTTLDGSEPYSPQGAAKMGSGQSALHIDMSDPGDKSYVESIANYSLRPPGSNRNPDQRKALMEEVIKVNPDYKENEFDSRSKAMKDFSTGKQGQAINSFNVGISHLNTLDGLAKALHNGDNQTVNAIGNRIADEFGVPAPSNFDAAKSIVGDEIAKAVVGAGSSALGDREEIKHVINSKKTPEELSGVIQTYKDLMAGQLKGLKKQYTDTTGMKNFDDRLSDETKTAIGGEKKADDGWSVKRVQ